MFMQNMFWANGKIWLELLRFRKISLHNYITWLPYKYYLETVLLSSLCLILFQCIKPLLIQSRQSFCDGESRSFVVRVIFSNRSMFESLHVGLGDRW